MESSNFDLKTLQTDNRELVYDMSFDWFGKRLAVVTAELKIKIYEKNDLNLWEKTADFKGHDGPIWKVRWSHPDYGSMIATCNKFNVCLDCILKHTRFL
jgi:WD40 repeat protein